MEALTITDTVAKALSHPHTCGMIHGDAKTISILYDEVRNSCALV